MCKSLQSMPGLHGCAKNWLAQNLLCSLHVGRAANLPSCMQRSDVSGFVLGCSWVLSSRSRTEICVLVGVSALLTPNSSDASAVSCTCDNFPREYHYTLTSHGVLHVCLQFAGSIAANHHAQSDLGTVAGHTVLQQSLPQTLQRLSI